MQMEDCRLPDFMRMSVDELGVGNGDDVAVVSWLLGERCIFYVSEYTITEQHIVAASLTLPL